MQMSSKEIIYEELLQNQLPKGKHLRDLCRLFMTDNFQVEIIYDLISETKSLKPSSSAKLAYIHPSSQNFILSFWFPLTSISVLTALPNHLSDVKIVVSNNIKVLKITIIEITIIVQPRLFLQDKISSSQTSQPWTT